MDGFKAGWEEATGVDGVLRIFGYVPPALPPKDFFLSAGQSKAEAFAAIDSATYRGVGLILAGLLAAIYAAWAGGRKFLSRPIETLLAVTAEWRNGNYEARAHLEDRGSEIGRLGLAFNEMADGLAARHAAQRRAEEELRHLNVTLESRIEQRTIELEGAIRAKSQFLANMSHEIRTPLNGVLGMLELVRQTALGPTQQRFVGTARRSAETLLGVINGVLDLSKIEADKVELEHSAFDLRAIVEEVTELFGDLAYGKGLELACFVPAHLPTALVGDSGRLRQILTNLVGNAIKFTEHGEVSVRADLTERNSSSVLISFEVADTGIGILPEKREHVFQAFAQADSSTTRRYGGTGLGRTIAKHFCEMMGGSIDVVSEPGIGSRFHVTARFGLQSEAAKRIGTGSRACGGRPVLIVTENALNRAILDDQLSARNVRFDQARSGSEALAALRIAARRGDPFGLAIIENSIPDMTGIELAKAVKAGPANAGLRLVMLTSFDQDIDEADDGILCYLPKPIRQSALWDCLTLGDAEAAPTGPHSATGPTTQELGAVGARVLLVEDSPVNLEVGVAILESMGCTVETATNGLRALERYANSVFDLIFMDCQMPEMDGFDTTAEIRRREALSGRRTPIVALTASVLEGGSERCIAAGMDEYLAKPFTREQIKSMLIEWRTPPAPMVKRDHLELVPAAPPPTPIDNNVLESLGKLQREGRPDIVEQVVNLYLKGAVGLMRDLEEGAANGDAGLLYQASHALKSASANVGAFTLSSRCQELEAIAQQGVMTDSVSMVGAILEDYRAVEVVLAARLRQVA